MVTHKVLDSGEENRVLLAVEGIEGQRCSKTIFNNRQGVGWVARVMRTMEVNGMKVVSMITRK